MIDIKALEGLTTIEAATLLAGVEIFGDYSAKVGNLPGTLVSYNALAVLLTALLKHNPLGLTNLYWNALSNWIGVAIGYLKGESMSNYQYAGGVLITTGILLLGFGVKDKKK